MVRAQIEMPVYLTTHPFCFHWIQKDDKEELKFRGVQIHQSVHFKRKLRKWGYSDEVQNAVQQKADDKQTQQELKGLMSKKMQTGTMQKGGVVVYSGKGRWVEDN